MDENYKIQKSTKTELYVYSFVRNIELFLKTHVE